MKHLKPKISFLFVCILILSACGNRNAQKDNLISRKWAFSSINGKETDKQAGDFMLLTRDGKFSFQDKAQKILSNGAWRIAGDSIVFKFAQANISHNIDSMQYSINAGSPSVIYYSKGKKLAEADSKGFSIDSAVKKYKVIKLANNALCLSNGQTELRYSYDKTETVSSFSWQGFFNGMIGLLGLMLITFLLSNNKRRINWPLIFKAIVLQFLFAFCVLKIPFFSYLFGLLAGVFVTILEFTKAGSTFLFGGLVSNTNSFGFLFVFQVLPTIIFFAALTSILFYLNILQRIVYVFAWIMKRIMNLSGAESLASAANIFIGQTEAPLVIKPYIPGMTRSETMALMTGGMAHISGGVLAAYVGFLGGSDPEQQRLFATHLLSASIMTAPGTFFSAKMLIPETEDFNQDLKIPREKLGRNILDAIANGTSEGMKLAVNVGAMLLVFISLMAMLNYILLHTVGDWTGLNEKIIASSNGRYQGLSLQYLLGYIFAPIAWLIGIRGQDTFTVGQLLGQKTILNEFVSYIEFSKLKAEHFFVHSKSIIITTYALCGFANFASIGIQLGGIGTLAPSKRPMLAELGIKALIGGTIANLMSATIAGMMI